MEEKNSAFLERLLSTFRIEAEEHLKLATSGMLELEKTSVAERQMTIVENIFREVHSLKGAARAVNMTDVETLCQSLETVFAAWKRKEIHPSPELFDFFHQAVDHLSLLITPSEDDRAPAANLQIWELADRLEKVRQQPRSIIQESEQKEPAQYRGFQSEPAAVPLEEWALPTETVRIATAKLDAAFLKTEELLSVRLATAQHAAELREISAELGRWQRQWLKVQPEMGTIRRNLGKTAANGGASNGYFTKLSEFLDWNLQAFTALEGKVKALEKSAQQDHRVLGGMVDDLLIDMKQVLILPFGTILETFPRLVRNLSRDQAKDVELVIEGAEIEIDRRILEEIKDPLIHLIRNCIDHGIEKPEERTRTNKSPRGMIKIAISQKDSSKVQILISDDGRGIDLTKVRVSAVKLGFITPREADSLGDQEILPLIFRSGVSTSPMITDISGRGLGLAIVREKAERLGGTVAVEARPGGGTTFHLVLPLTMATFRGIPVRVDEHLFVLPSTQVSRVAQIKKETIKTVENKETIELDGEAISLVRLGDVLELPRKDSAQDSKDTAQVVLIDLAQNRIAFLIDEVLNEQEVLVKSLGRQLARVRNVAGATVLATRKLAPILNLSDLMTSAVRASEATVRSAAPLDQEKLKKKSVLVVEDSITARTLLKSILEGAGYDVVTAVDGVDAFTQLRGGEPDLVISDVEMPRMNGFDLTAKIRSDEKLSELPVILVTALESREDKEQGIDVGADAYIVKSRFDQSNLLEAVRRLI